MSGQRYTDLCKNGWGEVLEGRNAGHLSRCLASASYDNATKVSAVLEQLAVRLGSVLVLVENLRPDDPASAW